MGIQTHQYKVIGRTLNIKMKKKDAERVIYDAVHRVANIEAYKQEITGTINEDGTDTPDKDVFTSQILFGKAFTLSEEGKAEQQKVVDGFPDLITVDNVDEVRKACQTFYDKYVLVDDRRKTKKAKDDQAETWRKEEEVRAVARKQKEAQRKMDEDALIKEYPYLMVARDSGKAGQVVAAENIRRQLARKYPGFTFSVTSKSFSMGDHVNVSWTDGPTTDEIDEIIHVYRNSSFDGMDDSTHSIDRAWHVFGDTRFTNTSRRITAQRYRDVATELGITTLTIPDDETHKQIEGPHQDRELVTRETWARSFYVRQSYPCPTCKKENEFVNQCGCDKNNMPTTISGTNAVVRKNEEHNGVEVVFPSKPAPTVLDLLRSNGFRWSPRQKLWYAKYSDQRMEVARTIAD